MVTLDQVRNNQHARIVQFYLDSMIKQRLVSSGISAGCFIKILAKSSYITVRIGSRYYKIKREIAEKIRVIKVDFIESNS